MAAALPGFGEAFEPIQGSPDPAHPRAGPN